MVAAVLRDVEIERMLPGLLVRVRSVETLRDTPFAMEGQLQGQTVCGAAARFRQP